MPYRATAATTAVKANRMTPTVTIVEAFMSEAGTAWM